MPAKTALFYALLALLLNPCPSLAEDLSEADTAYIQSFEEHFKKADPVPRLADYASPARFDERFLGEGLAKAIELAKSNPGNIAWGTSYYLMALNGMYEATHQVKYLSANHDLIRAVMSVRDNRIGKQTWQGESAPAWGSDAYSDKGRAVFTVHTGVILAPIVEFLLLAKAEGELWTSLGDEPAGILKDVSETLMYHEIGWRNGPGEDEGRYISTRGETKNEGETLPGNWQSAMGNALWLYSEVTDSKSARERALRIGRLIKRRLTLAPDGAYYWPYWLPAEPVTGAASKDTIQGEDTSHASLSASFPILLASRGEVFDREDMRRMGQTVLQGFAHLGDGILKANITGDPKFPVKYVQQPSRWLSLSNFEPEVYPRIAEFYLRYCPSGGGPLELADLIRYAPVTAKH